MDLANLDSVREFCQSLVAEEARIDVLINNAGNAPWEKVIDITDDGLEYQTASNYFGHFLMTNLIIGLFLPMKNKGTIWAKSWGGHELNLPPPPPDSLCVA